MQGFLTVDELIERAKAGGRSVTRQYVARLCQEAKLSCRKIGPGRRGVWLIPSEEAKRWLAEWLG